MTENTLIEYIKKCHREKDDVGIVIPSNHILRAALNVLINNSENIIRMFIIFDDNGKNSEYFNLLDDNLIINNLTDFLKESNSKIVIGSNKVKTIRNSSFFINTNNNSKIKDKVIVRSISQDIYNSLKDRSLINEFILSEPNMVLFGNSSTKDIQGEKTPFINFNEPQFYKTLLKFFNMTVFLKNNTDVNI